MKRGGDDLTRLKKYKITCNEGLETVDSSIADDVHGDFNQDFWEDLTQEVASNSSKSVVSIALSDGNTVLFACSGIAIEHQGSVTRFLTSSNLASTLNDKTKDHANLKIEVCHEGNVVPGFLGKCDLELGIAVVNITAFLDVQIVLLDHMMEFEPYGKVVAVGRGISGKLIATSGMLTPDASGSEDSDDLMLSTCKISEAWEGGPLFDLEGNFVGMNLFFVKERTLFLPSSIIFERLVHFRMSMRRSKFLAQLEDLKASRSKNNVTDDLARSSNKNKETDDLPNSCKKNEKTCDGGGNTNDSLISDVLNKDPFPNLDSMGYPKLVKDVPNDRLVLVDTFEDTFGDMYGGGVWSELSETVSLTISQNVVSLASFYGGKRIFACTGSFIEWNGCETILTSASLVSDFIGDKKIAENLRIEVLLPNKERRGGALQHYNLHYNVALVNVKDFSAQHPAKFERQTKRSSPLIAIGCSFKSGILMAARGQRTEMLGRLDCKLLKCSTCKITKAGIGGPLADFEGKFIGMNFCGMDLYGMNFYHMNGTGTPFLPSDVILDVLAYFKTKRTVAEVGLDGYASGVLDWAIDGDSSVRPNSWPVPKARYSPRQFAGEGSRPKRAKQPNRFAPPTVRIINGEKVSFL